MRKKQYRKFSKSFKLEALRLLESSEKPAAEIERDLGITPGLLGKWKTRYQIDQESGKLASNELQAARREIRRLERELEIAQQERDILKKAVGIFSQEEKD
ncbi:MAG: transposase [Anaerolineales bacterium]